MALSLKQSNARSLRNALKQASKLSGLVVILEYERLPNGDYSQIDSYPCDAPEAERVLRNMHGQANHDKRATFFEVYPAPEPKLASLVRYMVEQYGAPETERRIYQAHTGRPSWPIDSEAVPMFRRYRNNATPNPSTLVKASL